MKWQVFESWLLLLHFDCLIRFCDFPRVHQVVREYRVKPTSSSRLTASELSRAIDLACVFYIKRVLCLQRSAALTILLRYHGCKAEMVVGAQVFPFLSHAWVEVEGQVINDKPYVTQMFQVLDRC
jgi:hypothetical protein